MMGGHDRRLAKLESALPAPPIVSEDGLLIAEIVLGPARACQLRQGGYEDLAADERQQILVAITNELAWRAAAGMSQ